MILIKPQLIKAIEEEEIVFDGSIDNIGSNSIDVTLNKTIKTYVPCKIIEIERDGKIFNKIIKNFSSMNDDFFISMNEDNKVYSYDIPEEGLILSPDILYLGSTNEIAGSDHYLPMYEGRSSTARLGLQSHLSAGFGDLGFKSNWTLEIIVIQSLLIFANSRIGQVYFHSVDEKSKNQLIKNNDLYNSKYNKQPEAQASKMYLDFKKNKCKNRKENNEKSGTKNV